MASIRPQVGRWYKDLELGQIFEVVAIDEDLDAVEVQMLEGELCEYDMETWRDLNIETVEEPEDWRDAFELSDDDYKHWGESWTPESWTNPVSEIESDVINGLLDDY